MLVTSISRSRRRCTLGVKSTGDMILPLSVVYICVYLERRRYNTCVESVLTDVATTHLLRDIVPTIHVY
jgi:hypothetical protein